jgi:hypothetical protein
LDRQRRVDQLASDDLGDILFDWNVILVLPITLEHSARYVPLQIQSANQVVPSLVQHRGDPPPTILGQHSDVGAVQPVALRVVLAEPVVIHRFDVAVLDVIEIDLRPEIGRATHHSTRFGHHGELPFREASHVSCVVGSGDDLVPGERREGGALDTLQLLHHVGGAVHDSDPNQAGVASPVAIEQRSHGALADRSGRHRSAHDASRPRSGGRGVPLAG